MAVLPADLVEPSGKVALGMFPGESLSELTTRLQAYINEGVDKQTLAESDVATKAWAYHRTFLAVYLWMSAAPEKVEVDEQGGHTYGAAQASRFKKLSEEALEEWTLLTSEVVVNTRPASGSVKTTFTW